MVRGTRPQTVTVTVVDDDDGTDETVSITHAVTGYTGVSTGPTVSVRVTDDEDIAAVIVQSGGSTELLETGGTDTYTVKLGSKPSSTVTVTITSSDAAAALVSTTAAAAKTTTLTFSPTTWDTPQTVTVTGVEDTVNNPGLERSVTISHSFAGGGYDAVTASVTAKVTDKELFADLIFVESSGSTSVAEGGGTDTYTVELQIPPTHDVTVTVTSATPAALLLDGPDSSKEATSTETLTFTKDNWNIPQTITVTRHQRRRQQR